jgi:hypothetical protein
VGWIRYLQWQRGLIAIEPIGRLPARPRMPEVERLWEQEIAARGAAAAG